MLLKEEGKKESSYVSQVVTAFILILLVQWFFPQVIPFNLFEFWQTKAPLWLVIKSSWPLFVWGGGMTLLYSVLTRNKRDTNRNAGRILVTGFVISAFAGITEEIIFRWIFFFSSLWGIQLTNWLVFGWAGFGLPEWLYTNCFTPLASFFTLGKIDTILYHPLGWFVGAAVIAANAKFRDGHKYLGLFGFINSWVIGMYLFWMMFQYGLVACIVVHFLYDMLIFLVRYANTTTERARGYCYYTYSQKK